MSGRRCSRDTRRVPPRRRRRPGGLASHADTPSLAVRSVRVVDAPLGQALSVSGSQFVTAHINSPASARTLWRVVSWATPGAGPQNVIIFEHCRSSRRSHGGGKVTARGFQGTRADARPGQARTAAGPPRRPPSQAPPAPGADRGRSRRPGDRGRRLFRRRRLERVVRHEQGEEHGRRLDDDVRLGAQLGGRVGECQPSQRGDATDVRGTDHRHRQDDDRDQCRHGHGVAGPRSRTVHGGELRLPLEPELLR